MITILILIILNNLLIKQLLVKVNFHKIIIIYYFILDCYGRNRTITTNKENTQSNSKL